MFGLPDRDNEGAKPVVPFRVFCWILHPKVHSILKLKVQQLLVYSISVEYCHAGSLQNPTQATRTMLKDFLKIEQVGIGISEVAFWGPVDMRL